MRKALGEEQKSLDHACISVVDVLSFITKISDRSSTAPDIMGKHELQVLLSLSLVRYSLFRARDLRY